MIRLECRLRGAKQYCQIYPGWCCRECPRWTGCDRACLNTPEVCGYSAPP